MFCIRRRAAAVCAGLVAALAWSTSSFADDSAAPAARTESSSAAQSGGPALLAAGVITFGLAYIPAVSTATTSSLPIDKHLLVPIAGPWIDLANRPNCGPGAALSCNAEIGNQALLIVDGFFQGLALIQILAGATQVSRDAATPVAKIEEKPSVRVQPAQLGSGGYGLAALGRF
jgi:hypothetical protein